MTEIKSVNAPAIGQAGVERLFHMTRATPMTAKDAAFQAGYEQAKRDFRTALNREVGIPEGFGPNDDPAQEPGRAIEITPAERRARRAGETKRSWWG